MNSNLLGIACARRIRVVYLDLLSRRHLRARNRLNRSQTNNTDFRPLHLQDPTRLCSIMIAQF